MSKNQMELKFYKHGVGTCQKCGTEADELFKAVTTFNGLTKDFVLCKKCALALKKTVEKKNAEEKVNNQNSVADTTDKFCVKCGAKLEAGELFCGNCGAKVSDMVGYQNYRNSGDNFVPKKKSGISSNKSKKVRGNGKKKNSKKIILIVGLVLLFAAITVGAIFGVKIYQELKTMVVYTDDCPFEVVEFGSYEQDNNQENGKESIEWLVLDEQDGKKFLLSKYALDCMPSDYGENSNTYTWEENSLRNWLNNEFFNEAFSDSEIKRICNTKVYAEYPEDEIETPSSSEHIYYIHDNKKYVNDSLFLLSILEVQKYFNAPNNSLLCKATKYAKANSYDINYRKEKDFYVWWWLRNNNNSFIVGGDIHHIFSFLDTRNYFNGGFVRPAMWVELGNDSSYDNTTIEPSTESKGLYTSTTNSPKINERSFQLGSYPQTKVNDSYLIGSLNNCNIVWKSLNYYAGDNDCDGTMKAYDIAYYADVDYNGEKYRAVRMDEYRPSLTSAKRVGTVPDDNTNQPKNSYYTGNVYWFKYEPITWTVLDESSGLAITDLILDAQPFTNYIYKGSDDCYYGSNGEFSNNWEDSYLREWLNGDFYDTAFTYSEKSKIKSTYVNNSFINGTDYGYNRSSTYDNVFVLSYEELTNSYYGFDSDYSAHDNARSAFGTDYARSQNLDIFRSENVDEKSDSQFAGRSYFGTRTVGKGTRNICYVDARGYIQNFDYVHDTSCGVRPAICINN